MQPMNPTDGEGPPPTGAQAINVSFHPAGKLFLYRATIPAPPIGAAVVVPTDRGPTIAHVATTPHRLPGEEGEEIPEILRVATSEDLTQEDRNRERELRGTRACLTLIGRHNLPMKLVKVHYLLGGQKAVFYFTADGRVDFRALVKDLARELRVRVEMRQIGVRDETKMVGGVGHCGLELCCSTWLRDFVPVSIRMAKDQNLALNPQKVSGACGRLLCCLAYEHETYVEHRKEMPKVGRRVNTNQGPGKVINLEVLRQRFVVQLDGDGSRVLMETKDLLESKGGPQFSRESRRPAASPPAGSGEAIAEGEPPAQPQEGTNAELEPTDQSKTLEAEETN